MILPYILAFLLLWPAMPALGQVREGYSAPRLDRWRILGPGGGGAQFYPAVSPHDSNLVLAACDMTGAYISKDGGNSWRMFNLGSPVKFFAFDPNDSKVIYAATQVLWRSADRGRTWSLVYPPPASVTRVTMPDDHASPIVETAEGPAGPVTALAVDPADSKKLYAAIGGAAIGGPGRCALYASSDWGGHWQRSADLAAGGRQIYVDSRSPLADRTLYVIGTNSVSIRKAGEWKQGPSPSGVGEFRDASAGFASDGRLIVYALAAKGRGSILPAKILVSRDGGTTWSQADDSLARLAGGKVPLPELDAVATSLSHPEVAYVSYEGLGAGPNGKRPFHGVAKTTDSGATWRLVWKEGETPAANVHD
ncbi:MAG: hypothetical protein DMG25_01155, partial [Acidobacteria bacterium]